MEIRNTFKDNFNEMMKISDNKQDRVEIDDIPLISDENACDWETSENPTSSVASLINCDKIRRGETSRQTKSHTSNAKYSFLRKQVSEKI